MMKEEFRKYLKDTFHVTHKGFVKYFLLRTSGEAIPQEELASEVGCCNQTIYKWDEAMGDLGIINQEGVMYCKYINGNREYIGESEFYACNMYNQIKSLYNTLLGLTPFAIEKATKRQDTTINGTKLSEIFSDLQKGLQNIDVPITEKDFIVNIAPIFEVDTDNEIYVKTMLMIARHSNTAE